MQRAFVKPLCGGQIEMTRASDLGLLLGSANAASVRKGVSDGVPQLSLDIPPERMGGMAGRINQSLPVGNEGQGPSSPPVTKQRTGSGVGLV